MMNALWNRGLRTVYRKEPITGFLLTAGAVNVAIGGIDQSSALVFFGLSVVSVALALRWWQHFHRKPSVKLSTTPERVPVRALPPSPPSLPNLSVKK
jgi:hypothetical protein